MSKGRVERPTWFSLKGPAEVDSCHYQVCHGAAPNTSPYTRYATYSRLRHVNLPDHRFEAMKDIWMDWEGMRDVVVEAGKAFAAT